jgi:60 kDa SS-A/Ro ribonucleoprotein
MVSTYVRDLKARSEPVIEPPTTIRNNEGGKVSQLGRFDQLRRFLVLGSESNSYYADADKLTAQNVGVVLDCIQADGPQTVKVIVDISNAGRAPKNEPALLALALCTVHGDEATRRAAYRAIGNRDVVRIPTHLMHLFTYREALSEYTGRGESRARVKGGLGSGYKRAIQRWYNEESPDKLAYHAIKYQARDGVSQADLLRLAHPLPPTEDHRAIYKHIVDGAIPTDGELKAGEAPYRPSGNLVELLDAADQVRRETDPERAAGLIRNYRLPRETVNTALLNSPVVWEALAADMPMTALIRNLNKLTQVGLLTPGSETNRNIVAQLSDFDRIKKARVHPLNLLVALKVYEQGKGERGSLTWTPVKSVISALDEAFYGSFKTITPTGQRIRLAVDISASMDGNKIGGMPFLSAREVAGAMALVIRASEPNVDLVAYETKLSDINHLIRPSMRLDEVIRKMRALDMGGTICSLPISDAFMKGREFDAFVSLTDSETFDGRSSYRYGYSNPLRPEWGSTVIGQVPETVNDWLIEYRRKTGIPAVHAVLAFTSTQFTIANPNDPGQLDIAGFDSAVPTILNDFIAGRI